MASLVASRFTSLAHLVQAGFRRGSGVRGRVRRDDTEVMGQRRPHRPQPVLTGFRQLRTAVRGSFDRLQSTPASIAARSSNSSPPEVLPREAISSAPPVSIAPISPVDAACAAPISAG